MTRKRRIQVTAAIIRRDGRILLARRPDGSHLAGHWEFPGGKIEDGETPEECLARELEEEFTVPAEIGEFVASSQFSYDHVDVELLAFEASFGSAVPKPVAHDRIVWVRSRELLDYELAPADIPIAKRLVLP